LKGYVHEGSTFTWAEQTKFVLVINYNYSYIECLMQKGHFCFFIQ